MMMHRLANPKYNIYNKKKGTHFLTSGPEKQYDESPGLSYLK
jgi:hypothetical protein